MYSSAVLLLLASTLELVSSDTVSSRLFFHLPESLRVSSGYEHREALFGIPPYGGAITQQVYWADSQLCSSDVDKTMGYPKNKDSDSGEIQEWKPPYILMVDRGNCTFVTKVRNAQRAGASGVLIADDQCQCTDDNCIAQQTSTVCEKKEPIMADDGSGSDVSIPSFLMAKHDADKVKTVLKENQFVQVEMKWSIPSNDDLVEYNIWSTPSDPVSVDFFDKFKVFAKALKGRASFTPHAYIIDGVSVNCQSGSENYCFSLCSNNGRYCALDPDSNVDSGVSGKDVVVESLRRLCIWEIYGKADGVGEAYWDYISTFNEQCKNNKYFTDMACIRDAYKVGNVDESKIEQCMNVDFGQDASIQKFDQELRTQESQGIVVIPTAFVNNAAIRGHLTAENMFHAICAGFAVGSEPEICLQCASCADSYTCVTSGVCTTGYGSVDIATSSSSGVSKSTFSSSIFFIICIFVALGVWHYKKTKDEMRDQVRGILAEYMPLEDNDGAGAVRSPMDFAHGGTNMSLMS